MRICADQHSRPFFVSTAAPAQEVALFFYDGPHPVFTRTLLAMARAAGVKLTLCLVGRNVEKYPDIVRAGFCRWPRALQPFVEPCNAFGRTMWRQEIEKTDEAIRKSSGHNAVNISRARWQHPFMWASATKGRPFINWHTDTLDWKLSQHSAYCQDRRKR